MNWYWEKRGDAEFTPPNINTIFVGWEAPKADLHAGQPVPKQTEIFVRELVQNFVDASREQYSPGTKPKLSLRFVTLKGEEAKSIVEKLGLNEIGEHFDSLSEDSKRNLRIGDSTVISGDLNTVRLLVATETGTSGMYGQWERPELVRDADGREIKNKMRDALLSNVRDAASAGKGLGSYGEGKKAVIGISAPRTLFAYTCFDPNSSSEGVYSRFIGALYWENHIVQNSRFAGLALLGQKVAGQVRPVPFTDSAADDYVNDLSIPGLESRNNNGQLDTGTTMVFLEPTAEPQDVAVSIARNWWPLIVNDSVDFEVIDDSGNQIEIRFPSELDPFIAAYGAAETVKVGDWESAANPAFLVEELRTSIAPKAGTLRLSIDFRHSVGFSRANPEKNWSLVTLIRNGMVVSYQNFPKGERDHAPFVRGVFEVNSEEHPESERMLRKIEPPLHNSWPERSDEVDKETAKHSREVTASIKEAVARFKKEHVANLPEIDQELPLFRELLGIKGTTGITDPLPDPDPNARSPIALLNSSSSVAEGSKVGTRVASASRTISLKANAKAQEIEATVTIGWEVLQENTWVDISNELMSTVSKLPSSFAKVEGSENTFIGLLGKERVEFSWQSNDYSQPWTLRPYMSVLTPKEVPNDRVAGQK